MRSAEPLDRETITTFFFRGVEQFNGREFWEAHESWEKLWLAAGAPRQFLQGLIQGAAAYHQVRRSRLSGAARLFAAALRRLEPFPPGYMGLNRSGAVKLMDAQALSARNGVEVVGEYPLLLLEQDWQERLLLDWEGVRDDTENSVREIS